MRKLFAYGLASVIAAVLTAAVLFGYVAITGAIFAMLFWSADFIFGTQMCTTMSVGIATLVFICLRMAFHTGKD
jgi:hypothetical protein